MRTSRWIGMAMVAVAACGDGGEPVTPAGLAIVSGNTQLGFISTTLSDSLVVRVTGSDGDGLGGVTVAFAVPAGTATVSPPSAQSDDSGLARTQVTLGSTAGSLTITGTVTGLPPVTFTANACDVVSHTIGTTSNGTLALTDCSLGGYFTDFFDVTLPAQEVLTIRQTSVFNTWMDMALDVGTFFIAFNEDDPVDTTSTNARIDVALGPGRYLLAPSSSLAGVVGDYSLITATRSQDPSGCELLWSSRAVTITGVVNLTDCKDSVAAGLFYSDVLIIALELGDTLRASLSSGAFDPFLTVVNLSGGAIVASNDDSSASTTTAFITWVATASTIVVLDLGTANPGENGAYIVRLAGPVAAAAPRHLDFALSRSELRNAPSRAVGRRPLRPFARRPGKSR